jgi:hypothetical protein
MADYAGVLADLRSRLDALEHERSEIQTAIAAIERIASVAAGGQGQSLAPPVDEHQFSGMPLQAAIAAHLSSVREPQSVREIAEAVKARGYKTKSPKFTNIVYNTLNRLSQGERPIFGRVEKRWVIHDGQQRKPQGTLLIHH